MLAYNDKARQFNIERIDQLIETLGHVKLKELGYLDYRAIVDYLNVAKKAYREEMEEAQ